MGRACVTEEGVGFAGRHNVLKIHCGASEASLELRGLAVVGVLLEFDGTFQNDMIGLLSCWIARSGRRQLLQGRYR
jgi:hypothetical protein